MAYEDYNAIDGEMNHVHVEIPCESLDCEYAHMTRIAEHGVDRIVKDGGWMLNGKMQRDANLVYNWGRGPTVKLRAGKVEA
jgi:hypothetical protein